MIHIPHKAECVERVERPDSIDEQRIGVGRAAQAAKRNPDQENSSGVGTDGSEDKSTTVELSQQSMIDGLASLQQQLIGMQKQSVEEIEQVYESLTDIGVKIAEKFLIRAADDNRQAVEQLVREVVQLCGEPSQLVVRVNPEDASLLAEHLTGEESFTVESDSQLKRGECVADSGQFVASLRWSNRLAEIRQEIIESLNDSLS